MNDWTNTFRKVRKKLPYDVHQFYHNDFLDLQKLGKEKLANLDNDCNGGKINWASVKSMRFGKSKPGVIEYKYNYHDDFQSVNTRERQRPVNVFLCAAYTKTLPISLTKKNDLLKLCRKMVIPREFHPWYAQLNATKNAKDSLP